METTPKIYAAICNAMADISHINKGQKNESQKYMYRSIDDAMNALYPVLVKHRLFLAPEVLEQTREHRQTKSATLMYSILKVRYTLYAEDGSNVSAVVVGEGMDTGDKASNKAIAAAMKYAIFQLFCIPTEEVAKTDSDIETPDESMPVCSKCKNVIQSKTLPSGREMTASEIADRSRDSYGQCLCWDCSQKARAAS